MQVQITALTIFFTLFLSTAHSSAIDNMELHGEGEAYFLKFIKSGLWRHVVVSFVLFAFALLSKATVIILPLILVTFLYFKPAQKPRDYAITLPFFLLAVVFFFIFKFYATESEFIKEEMVFGVQDFDSRIVVALQIPFF